MTRRLTVEQRYGSEIMFCILYEQWLHWYLNKQRKCNSVYAERESKL